MRRDLGHPTAPDTPAGRKKLRIVGALIGVAALSAIVASLVSDHSLSMRLFGIAAGLMVVGVVYILIDRRPR